MAKAQYWAGLRALSWGLGARSLEGRGLKARMAAFTSRLLRPHPVGVAIQTARFGGP